MAALDELAHLLGEKGRRILVAENPVDLKMLGGKNSIFVLQLPEGSLAAGGRAGGFGVRKIEEIYAFHYEDGASRKIFEVDSPEKLESFELPYHAAGTPIIMPDRSERVILGVIDPRLVVNYKQII